MTLTTYINIYPDGAAYHHSSMLKAWDQSDVDRVGTVRVVIKDGRITDVKEIKILKEG